MEKKRGRRRLCPPPLAAIRQIPLFTTFKFHVNPKKEGYKRKVAGWRGEEEWKRTPHFMLPSTFFPSPLFWFNWGRRSMSMSMTTNSSSSTPKIVGGRGSLLLLGIGEDGMEFG
jgi:hypothetical protein